MQPVNKTILIIDDDADFQLLLSQTLRKSGFRVLSSFSGKIKEALSAITRPDIILLDIKMPDTNGVELGKHLKSDPKTKDIPIIVISSHDDVGKLSQEAGANDYVPKPFNISDFVFRIRQKLGLVKPLGGEQSLTGSSGRL